MMINELTNKTLTGDYICILIQNVTGPIIDLLCLSVIPRAPPCYRFLSPRWAEMIVHSRKSSKVNKISWVVMGLEPAHPIISATERNANTIRPQGFRPQTKVIAKNSKIFWQTIQILKNFP